MKAIILKQSSDIFFKKSHEIESSLPDGQWRYFKFNSKNEVLGIYENSLEGLELHPNFFKYFLGQFNSILEKKLSINQSNDFKSFCTNLNTLLLDDVKILDLSISSFWIWYHDKNGASLSSKLKDYLNF